MPGFERFLVSSGPKASWSHSKPKKSNSVVSPGSVDPLGTLGRTISKMNKKLALSPLVIEAKSQVRKVLESQITFKSPYKRQINLELLSHACK